MAYADLGSELSGQLPGLSGFLADNFVQRAWKKIRGLRLWSFQDEIDSIVCPAVITAGTFNIVQYTNRVTANAAASAALLALPPLVLPLIGLQIRFMPLISPPALGVSQIYTITAVDSSTPTALVLTLDRAIVEGTSAASAYMVYRAYIDVPVDDFVNWTSVSDMVNGIAMTGERLTRTSKYFDRIDPSRQSLGLAFNLGYFKRSDDGVPMYELWPGPTQGQVFSVRYRRLGADFVNAEDVQPTPIADGFIIQCALAYYALPWARMNVGHFPALAKTNWSAAINDAKEAYAEEYRDARRLDDEIKLQSIIRHGHGLRSRGWIGFPIDSNFIQSHLVNI